MSTTIAITDLKPGDVFLYQGTSLVARLIRLFDGTEYSHASIYDGAKVAEALSQGITTNTVADSVAGSNFVDVYRFISADKHHLGDTGYPAAKVIARVKNYEEHPQPYAYDDIILLALLCTSRHLAVPLLGAVVRNILDTASEKLSQLLAAGKQPMICSEFVFRCYAQAGNKYYLTIRGADAMTAAAQVLATAPTQPAGPKATARAATGSAAAPGWVADVEATDPEVRQTQAAARAFLDLYRVAKQADPEQFIASSSVASAQAVANFVTPGDLKKSPNLYKVGTLKS